VNISAYPKAVEIMGSQSCSGQQVGVLQVLVETGHPRKVQNQKSPHMFRRLARVQSRGLASPLVGALRLSYTLAEAAFGGLDAGTDIDGVSMAGSCVFISRRDSA
jgi:hypothetical protein